MHYKTRNIFISIIFIISLSLAFISFAQVDSELPGWGKVKWGMSKNQVVQLYKDRIKNHSDKTVIAKCSLILNDVKVLSDFNDVINITFCFDNNTSKLRQVIMSTSKDKGTYLQATRLLNSLIKKYGKPEFQEVDVDKSILATDKYTWIFSNATISLFIMSFSEQSEKITSRKAIISLSYTENSDGDFL